MLYVRNHPCTSSTGGKWSLLDAFLVCPAYGPHVSQTCPVGILRHCPILFNYCPFPTAHYHTITGQKRFCTYTLGTLSTRPQAITIQTNRLVPGYWLLSSSSRGPHLGPPFFFNVFCFVLFCFLSVFFLFLH